jgi:hypothetical protein
VGRVGCAGTGFAVALGGRTAIIEAFATADFVGMPGSGGGIKVSSGESWERGGHRIWLAVKAVMGFTF